MTKVDGDKLRTMVAELWAMSRSYNPESTTAKELRSTAVKIERLLMGRV